MPYSTVTALPPPDPAFGAYEDTGQPGGAGEAVVLNEWMAGQLGAKIGDRVELTYFEVGPREELRERSRQIAVGGIGRPCVAPRSIRSSPRNTRGSPAAPTWPTGIRLSRIELSRVRPADEDYWKQYRATPKAFLPLAIGQDWWRTRWGELSAVRIAPGAGEPLASFVPRFATALHAELEPAGIRAGLPAGRVPGPARLGRRHRLRRPSSASASSSSPAAALLVSLLMHLWSSRRSGEIGLRLAVGFRRAAARRGLLLEGAASAGGRGARRPLRRARLRLADDARPAHFLEARGRHLAARAGGFARRGLGAGVLLAPAITLITIALSLRQVGKLPVPQLLRRSLEGAAATGGGWKSRSHGGARPRRRLGAAGGGPGGRRKGRLLRFFLAGVAWLAGLLAAFGIVVQRPRPALRPGWLATWRIAIANTRRRRRAGSDRWRSPRPPRRQGRTGPCRRRPWSGR